MHYLHKWRQTLTNVVDVIDGQAPFASHLESILIHRLYVTETLHPCGHAVRIELTATANVVDNFAHEHIASFHIWPIQLLPKDFDLIENGQGVDSR